VLVCYWIWTTLFDIDNLAIYEKKGEHDNILAASRLAIKMAKKSKEDPQLISKYFVKTSRIHPLSILLWESFHFLCLLHHLIHSFIHNLVNFRD
jgi:hypothetical protein